MGAPSPEAAPRVAAPSTAHPLIGGVSSTVGVGGGVLGYSAGQWTNFRDAGSRNHRGRRPDAALLAGLFILWRPLRGLLAGRRSQQKRDLI